MSTPQPFERCITTEKVVLLINHLSNAWLGL